MFFLAFNVVELGQPFVMSWYAQRGLDVEATREFSSLRLDMGKENLESQADDYLEIILLLTMVLTFGISFPLAATLFWAMNFLEIRVDLVK